MSIARAPLLSPEMECKLRAELTPLWLRQMDGKYVYTADEIAEILEFGKERSPYEKLKRGRVNVYNYRIKFDLPPRKKQIVHEITQGGGTRNSRYKTQPSELMDRAISPEEYLDKIKEAYPLDFLDRLDGVWEDLAIEERVDLRLMARDNLMYAAYNIILMYSPLRKSEIYERTLADLVRKRNIRGVDVLSIELYRKKKGDNNPMFLPYDIRADYPGMEIVFKWLQVRREEVHGDETQLVFPISSYQAWASVKKVDPDAYPHYFRFKYITEELSKPGYSIKRVRDDTGLHISTIDRYLASGGEIARAESVDSRKKERV